MGEERVPGRIPSYDELLRRTDAPPGSSWNLFGPDDEVGTINFLTPERVLAAMQCVRRGVAFNLDKAINLFDPPPSYARQPVRHTIFSNNINHRDDYLDRFYLQIGSQIDGLRHVRHARYGFYNNTPDESVAVGTPRLGINRWADRGIVGRGVLIDVDRYLKAEGKPIDQSRAQAIPIGVIDAAARAQGVELRPGDILLLRTGWLRYYFSELSLEGRRKLQEKFSSPGLLQSHETLAWLWDHQFSVVASDNVGFECMPPDSSSPFGAEMAGLPGAGGFLTDMMHLNLIALLGFALGELWDLDALAEDCARDNVWECLVVAKPLNLIGGVGSPANALAIK